MIIRKTLEHQVLPIPFHILTLWGIWCPEHVQPRLRRFYFAFTCIVIISEILLTTEVFINLIIIIRNKRFELDVFFILTSLMNGLYKALNILLTRKRIAKLITIGFEDRWRFPRDDSEKKILQNYKFESWRIHLIYAGACLAGVTIKLVGPMMKQNADIEFPAPAWYPYDTNKPVYFWLAYVQQMFVGGATISMHIGADTMLSGLMLQSCIQLKLLKHRFKHFFQHYEQVKGRLHLSSTKRKVEIALMKQYICDHQFVYSYANKINRNFSGWLIAVLIVVVPNICINVYLLSFSKIGLNVDFITSLGLFSISLFQIYLPCWYGNEVMLHSSEIANSIYDMDWVRLSPTARKTLIIVMIRSSKPIQIRAGYFVSMNLRSFLSIMKTSYSALSVLQQTT
ncbi:odorant receptor 105 isoform X1 [Nasonia vitripennis]|uniref:Odorant receptor n=1 Tax=Nasonia vitripennis TaxID=7425 RepID=A0A7M7QNQ0_NASVI|nr:odorant receptor 105 [Nasonia vitripennis]XP_032452238.1 odorant receptor 105 isoform X1 [Nasonia vitripennis]